MRRILSVLILLWAVPAAGADVSFDRTYTQQNFRDFSEEAGAAIRYRSVDPAVSLGITGFNLGAEVKFSDISEKKDTWKKAVSDKSPPSYLANTRVTFTKGLPLGLDAGVVLGKVLDPDIPYFGAEVRYAIVKDRALVPGVSLRGSYSQTFNVDQLSLKTYGLDLSVSKGFGVGIKLVPYAGVGLYGVSSKASNLTAGLSLDSEQFASAHGFLGLRLLLGLLAVTAEVDYGVVPSYQLQLALTF